MHKKKQCPFQSITINKFNCFFSQICEVSHSQLQNHDIHQEQIMNSYIEYSPYELFIMTRGGTKFHIPMDQEVSKVFPMVEGILIEFYIKPEIRFHEILYYQNNRNAMEIQSSDSLNINKKTQGKYSYATLTRHPLNPLKVLGQLRNQQVVSWLKTQQQVITVSQNLPLLVSYNNELKRNAFHVLIANMSQIRKEYELAFIPTHSYSLGNLSESFHQEVLSLTLHEQSISGSMIKKIIINKSTKRGHIYLYVLTQDNEVKMYEISFFGTSNNSTKLIRKVKNISDIRELQLYNALAFKPKFFQNQNQVELIFSILYEQINNLKDCVCLINQSQQMISTYHNGHLVKKSKYENDYESHLNNQSQLIQGPFDSLILKGLQVSLLDDVLYGLLLEKYCNGFSLNQVILEALQQKRQLFYYLHLLFQQFKLYEFMREERTKLGPIMVKMAQILGKKEYLDYYARQGFLISDQIIKQSSLQIQEVYDIFDLIDKILFQKPMVNQSVFCIFNRSRFIIRFFEILIKGRQQISLQKCSRQNLSLSVYQHGNEYLYKVRFPLLSQKVFHINYFNKVYENKLLKNAKPENKQQSAFIYLIKHNQSQDSIDTYPLSIRAVFNWLLRQMRKNLPFTLYEDIPELGFNLIKRQDLYKNILLYRKKNIIPPYHLQKPSFDDHIKTLIHTSTSQEYFLTSNASQMNKVNNDLVFEEVDRLLSSTTQIKIKVKDIQSIPEEKWEVESQNILLKFANRKLAVIIGQGAFSLATSMSFITDIIKIPKINLNGIMPNDIKITLDLKDDKESIIYWPEFHAGMVAGLKLSRHVIPLSEDHLKTWIFYQKPDTPKRDHAGFLLSLGLQGYLKCFSPTDIYQYLKPNNEFTSVAILLGISASNISNSDESLTKALFLHIPALLPPSIDVQIPINVQTSALIGLGLLHKASCNRTMTQTALSQIGKLPRSDKCLEREGYSLAAGWALGMICLGMRDKKETFRDLQLEERLIRFIEGGKAMQPPQSITSTFHINQNKTSSVKQGNNVNLHVTAPSALLAISLMYLKSNNLQLSSKITIPNSFSTIQQCNPNHILLKTVAKNLIMWDNIGSTHEFVIGQVPEIIKFIYDSSLNKVYQRYYLVYNVSQIDYQTVTSIYVNVTTGAILSMALKYAGSGNMNVVSTIKKHIDHLKMMKIIKCEFANDPMNKNCIDQYELFSLLSCSILSLSIVMAGTCDIECLKIIRIIRKKFQDSKVFHYGFSMAINMAIGFLFLGYGNYTFNRSDMSIAALLISVFPQFPNSPSDNRWHLQALRHFYVLAMQEKIFHAVDVDTNKVVNANAQMQFQIQNKIYSETIQTPILLQENKKLMKIKIRDPDYFDVDFSFKDTKGEIKAIYIKRKYFKDINPKLLNPQNPLITQTTQKKTKQALNQQVRYRAIFLKDQKSLNPENDLSSKLGYLIKNGDAKKLKLMSDKLTSQKTQIHKQLYYRLLKQDKLELLEIYLNLKEQLKQMQIIKYKNVNEGLLINNIALLLNFQKFLGSNEFKNLIQDELQPLKSKILIQNKNMFQKYFINPHDTKLSTELYKLLGLFKIPQSKELIFSMQVMKKIKQLPNPQSVGMLFYLSHPESSFEYLNLVSESMYCSLKN